MYTCSPFTSLKKAQLTRTGLISLPFLPANWGGNNEINQNGLQRLKVHRQIFKWMNFPWLYPAVIVTSVLTPTSWIPLLQFIVAFWSLLSVKMIYFSCIPNALLHMAMLNAFQTVLGCWNNHETILLIPHIILKPSLLNWDQRGQQLCNAWT